MCVCAGKGKGQGESQVTVSGGRQAGRHRQGSCKGQRAEGVGKVNQIKRAKGKGQAGKGKVKWGQQRGKRREGMAISSKTANHPQTTTTTIIQT